jgi:hypothetical protein
MSGSNYTITCEACKAVVPLRGKALSLYVTCPSCKRYFSQLSWNSERIQFKTNYEPALKPGMKGKIDGAVYEVMGFVVKREVKYKYTWNEYLLFNPFKGYAFLSEYKGNWNFVWAIEDDPSNATVNWSFHYENNYYQLFQKYRAEVIFAQGEFFFDIVNISDSTNNVEYIAPPYMVALEKSDDSLLWCQGEYITQKEVAEAFKIPVSSLPPKDGKGYTEPISTNFNEGTLIKASLGLLALVILLQIFFANSSDNKQVISQTFDQSTMGDSTFFRTESFELTSSKQGVEVELYAPVDNNWFYAEFALIDEENGTEYNFSHEVEYYHGYDEGNWSEGSPSGTAFLSALPKGKYHINIYPDFSTGLHVFAIKVKRDVVFFSNFITTLLLIALFPVGYFVRKRMIESRRWSESDYSPYHSGDSE